VARLAFSLLVLLAATAFAPAPFPRPQRGPKVDEITIQTFQGTWRVASMKRSRRDGNHTPHNWNITHIRVEKDSWTFLENGQRNASYTLTITNNQKPAALDFYHSADNRKEPAPGQGIIRRKGDVVEIVYLFGNPKRATSFEQPPDNQWLLTLQKER
jgi:uncharacterized protein (TIGR03067 family)